MSQMNSFFNVLAFILCEADQEIPQVQGICQALWSFVFSVDMLKGVIASFVAAVIFWAVPFLYHFAALWRARLLFSQIVGRDEECLVILRKLKDPSGEGKYLSPRGEGYADEQIKKTSTVIARYDAEAFSIIMNTLGMIRRTTNIPMSFVDATMNVWDKPMFTVGYTEKTREALKNGNPPFRTMPLDAPGHKWGFRRNNNEPDENIAPMIPSDDDDMGLLQKHFATTGVPIWIVAGYRSSGTIASAVALRSWWKQLGALYGNKPFGILVKVTKGARENLPVIIEMYPKPYWYKKWLHWIAWRTLKKSIEAKPNPHFLQCIGGVFARRPCLCSKLPLPRDNNYPIDSTSSYDGNDCSVSPPDDRKDK